MSYSVFYSNMEVAITLTFVSLKLNSKHPLTQDSVSQKWKVRLGFRIFQSFKTNAEKQRSHNLAKRCDVCCCLSFYSVIWIVDLSLEPNSFESVPGRFNGSSGHVLFSCCLCWLCPLDLCSSVSFHSSCVFPLL